MVLEGASARLVAALAKDGEVPGCAVRTFGALAPMMGTGTLTERRITADQTNVSVVVAERVVVKWMRAPAAARAPKVLAHLSAIGFTGTPKPFAAVFRGGSLVAMVTAYLPGARDGWDWCVDAVLDALDGGPPADFAADLGLLTARLHAALATASDVIESPVRYAAAPSADVALVQEALESTIASDAEDGLWLAERVPVIAAEMASGVDAVARREVMPMIQIHGDLHVGQVLRWREGYAVIDFDGDPMGRPSTWDTVVRDVAQLRVSILHVAQIANRRSCGRFLDGVLDWGRRSADVLLDAYRTGLADLGLAELFDERLLRPYEVEQECRELIYAARFLPRWRYAPMGVLRSWYR